MVDLMAIYLMHIMHACILCVFIGRGHACVCTNVYNIEVSLRSFSNTVHLFFFLKQYLLLNLELVTQARSMSLANL